MTLKTTRFDAAEYLDTPEVQAAFVADAFETGDETYIKKALATVARARGMTVVAQDADLARATLYKSLSETGDPKLSTLMNILTALDMEISVRAKSPRAA